MARIWTFICGLCVVAVSTAGQPRAVEASDCKSLSVTIESPRAEEWVRSPWITVRGTSSGSVRMGVAVNNTPATLDLSHEGTAADPFPWVAVVTTARPGMVMLRAIATAPNCTGRDVVISIPYAPTSDRLELRAFPSSGAAPLAVEFELDVPPSRLDTIARYDMDLDGDDIFKERSEPPFSNLFEQPGIREAGVRIVDGNGKVLETANVPIVIESFVIVNDVLQSVWREFTGALQRGDIEVALAWMADEATRAKYRRPLELIRPSLATFAKEIETIHAVYIRGGVGYYILTRTIKDEVFGYPVYFQRGVDGVWRLVQF